MPKPAILGTMPETHGTQKEQAGNTPLDVLSTTNEITPDKEPAPYSLQLRMEDFNDLNQAPKTACSKNLAAMHRRSRGVCRPSFLVTCAVCAQLSCAVVPGKLKAAHKKWTKDHVWSAHGPRAEKDADVQGVSQPMADPLDTDDSAAPPVLWVAQESREGPLPRSRLGGARHGLASP